MKEIKILSELKNMFIIKIHFAFQDLENLYLVTDLINGGDLRHHIALFKRFTEEQTQFFIACIVQALETLHG